MAFTKTLAVLVLLCSACGSDDLVVSGALGKDEQCNYVPDTRYASARKLYDVQAADTEQGLRCEGSYYAQLLVSNEGSGSVVVKHSEVRLMTVDRHTIVFDRLEQALPNPFQVTVGVPVGDGDSAVVSVEAIPSAYGEQLDGFVGVQLLIQVTLEGSADGDEVTSEPFTFPVDICDGCLSFCATDPGVPNADTCDNTIRAGEVCIDEGC